MNFVGKILIVVQIVLSFLFMAFAGAVFAVQTNWRERVQGPQGLEQQLDEAKKDYGQQIADLNDRVSKLDQDFKTAQNDKNRFQATADGLKAQLTQEQEEHRKTREALAQESEIARVAGDEAEERRKESKKLRDENERLIAVSDDQAKQRRVKDDEIYTMEQENKVKARKQISLLRENKLLKSFIASNNLRFDTENIKTDRPLAPVVNGVVLETKMDKRGRVELVEISIGDDDGISGPIPEQNFQGDILSVYRTDDGKGKYLGEIRIVYVTPDRAVGIVLDRAKNGIIKKGDNVTTKL